MEFMSYRLALVGAGPTAIYCVQALLACPRTPASITIYERQRRAGQGTPYSANWADPIMLANIASIEIPPLPERLVDWLRSQTDARLALWGITREDIHDREFYPRLVLGEYLAAQFSALVNEARSMGIPVEVRTQCSVSDVRIDGDHLNLTVQDSSKSETTARFDYVILATGHQWPVDPEIRPGYFTSPWPASALARIHNCPVGIRGTSLSAIDASVGLASRHGEFVSEGTEIFYRPASATEKFSITLFSRKGILPEADFYHPIPYEPLAVCNSAAIEQLMTEHGSKDLLDKAFALFLRELEMEDPQYLTTLNLQRETLEEFCSAYFEQRAQSDPFVWARRNLAEAIANAERQITIPWRYAILRMHEVFGLLVPHLGDLDFTRFSELKAVFADNYATVPHDSVRRLLALHTAGKLNVIKLEDRVRLDTTSSSGGATILSGKERAHFPAFIEATGQQVATAKDFPFPSLRHQGVIQDAETHGDNRVRRGIAMDGAYHPISAIVPSDRLFCLSLPFLLGQHPFAQGITSSAEMAEVVADAIRVAEGARTPATQSGSGSGSNLQVPVYAQRVGIRRPGGVPPEVSGCPSPNPACAFRYAPGSPSMFTHREDQDPNPSYRAPRGLRTTVRGPSCHLAIAAPFGAACANRTEQRDHPSVCLGASCGASV
jgi:uncharacterized NAD(P)/FAD-binding protein YdhS